MIKLFDTERTNEHFRKQITDAVDRTMKDKLFRGAAVQQFEEEFAEYMHAPDCATVSSGSDALFAVALASGLRPGDEVLCTSYSFLATASMFDYIGVDLKFIDIEYDAFGDNPKHCCIDIYDLEQVVTSKTRAIIWTDFAGMTPDIDKIIRLKQKYPHILLIEDAAQATGTMYGGMRLGALADFTVHSFGHWKNLGAFGGGGAVTGFNVDQIREIRNHGRPMDSRFGRKRHGFNMEIHTLQADILLQKLRQHDHITDLKNEHAQCYSEFIEAHCRTVSGPIVPKWCTPSWYMYNVNAMTPPATYMGSITFNKSLQAHLHSYGIESKINYTYLLPEELNKGDATHFRGAYHARSRILGIPCHPFMTKEERQTVCEALQTYGEHSGD